MAIRGHCEAMTYS